MGARDNVWNPEGEVPPAVTPTGWTGCKVFSATKHNERQALGETVSSWRAANPEIEIVETEVRQSSDQAFHCLSITVFYR